MFLEARIGMSFLLFSFSVDV